MNIDTFKQELTNRLGAFVNKHRSSIDVLGDPWRDDGILCFKGAIATFNLDMMWAGELMFASWKYAATSDKALEDLLHDLNASLSNMVLDDLSEGDRPRYNFLLEIGFTAEQIDPLIDYAFAKVFYLRHGEAASEGVVQADRDYADEHILPFVHDGNDRYAFIEYWEEYYPEETDVIAFLKTRNIVKCGTLDRSGLDYFIVAE